MNGAGHDRAATFWKRRLTEPHAISRDDGCSRQESEGARRCDTETVPTVLRSGPYRVYFFSHEPNEPPHVHVDRDDQSAKFWLRPILLALNLGFSPVELRRIQQLLRENETSLMEKWNASFGD